MNACNPDAMDTRWTPWRAFRFASALGVWTFWWFGADRFGDSHGGTKGPCVVLGQRLDGLLSLRWLGEGGGLRDRQRAGHHCFSWMFMGSGWSGVRTSF